MTLRTRLTAAFLVVVLGPVLLGAGFVSYLMAAVAQDRSAHQLEVAAGAATSAVAGLCEQLHTAAELLAGLPESQQPRVAEQLLQREPFAAVRLSGPSRDTVLSRRPTPPAPWNECGGAPATGRGFMMLAARVEASAGPPGTAGGVAQDGPGSAAEVWVAARLDQRVVERLAAAAGSAVTLLDPAGRPHHSTDPMVDSTLAAAAGLRPGELGRSADQRWVRRLEPTAGQPLRLVLAVPADNPAGLVPLLTTVVAVAGGLAVVTAWRLGRTTTRPLTELAAAADRAAEGDLSVRVPVRGGDEAARLAAAFNRMTHQTQAYVQALTASRDQLRRHLTVLGETLSSTHDLGRILQVILQTAQAATAAGAGAVLLVDRAAGRLIGHAGPGPGERSPVAVPLSEGLLGTVASSGEPQRGTVTDRRLLHADEPDCRTYVVVPITAPAAAGGSGPARPAVRGVLALYDRVGGDEFDDRDLSTLRTFASQAGVAVQNVRAHDEAQRLSLTDPLTGLWNYRSLRQSIRRELERASRFHHPLAVLALDLDLFKDVNDAHGHLAGDAVLAEFAGRVRSVIREVDLAFRQGGEEFVILLPETGTSGAVVLAQRLGAAVRESPVVITPRTGAGRELSIHVTVSIGIAVYPEHATAIQDLLDAADDALYAAKRGGRDTYRVAAPATAELPVRWPVTVSDDDLPRAGSGYAGRARTASEPPTGGESAGGERTSEPATCPDDRPGGGAQPPRPEHDG